MYLELFPTVLRAVLGGPSIYRFLLRHWSHLRLLTPAVFNSRGVIDVNKDIPWRNVKMCTLLHKEALHPQQPSTLSTLLEAPMAGGCR